MNKYEIAANLELNNLSNFEGKMSAAQQRAVFGANVFGKKTVKIDNTNQGNVEVWYSAAFGTDTSHTVKSFDEIVTFLNTGYISF